MLAKSQLFTLDPFLDEAGLIRVNGRLEHSDLTYDSKHPVIIPKGLLAKLIVKSKHVGLIMKHAGVVSLITSLRANCYIFVVRKTCKTVIKQCRPINCQRHHSRPCSQKVAALPKIRVTQCPSQKFYILLFTCAVIRAIHVELTNYLSRATCDCILLSRKKIFYT